jgi:hypothetical protein
MKGNSSASPEEASATGRPASDPYLVALGFGTGGGEYRGHS